MKKIIIIILILGLTIYSWISFNSIQSEYNKSVHLLDAPRLGGVDNAVTWLQDNFGYNNFDLHNQLETMVTEDLLSKESGKNFLQLLFPDTLNKSGSILQYVPLYNRKNNKKESFLLISAGIDGKLNSKYSIGDTIYEDEYIKKFNFYNLKEYSERKSMNFNIIDFLFGSKDYLVRHFNCIEEIPYTPISLEYLNYRMRAPLPKQPMSIIASFKKDSITNNANILTLKSWMDGYQAFCKMHNLVKEKFTIGDTIMISGYLERIDENRNFHLTHCTLYANLGNMKTSDMLKLSKLRKRELKNREKILNQK